MKQEALRADLDRRTDEIVSRVRGLAAMSAAQHSWSPPDGGWSVGQVLEHLVANTTSYLAPLERVLTQPAKAARSLDHTWKPSIIGNLLVRSLQSSRRLPAPKVWQPGPEARPGVTDALVGAMTAIASLMDRGRELRWESLRLSSPASALVRLNAGDVFLAIVVHAERHLGQIGRIRSSPGFPED